MKASGTAPLFVLLRWERPDELARVCEQRRRQHLGFVAGLLSASLRDGPLGQDGPRLLARLAALPDEGVARILGAPQVSHALCTHEHASPQVLYRLLDQALEAEQVRSEPDRPATRELWTALGDLRFEPGHAGPTLRARLVDEHFIVDHDSPYRDARLVPSEFRPEFGEAVALSPQQRALVDERIAEATAGLRAVSPAAYSLAASMIRTVMPRIDERNPTFKGSSNRAMAGRVNLFNPHLDYINPGVIASSLVHEAIHILLYLFEQQEPLVTDERRAHEVRITSPWSGKRVDLLAIVHASFVWHALLHLWRLPGIEEHFAQREVLYYRSFCARGLHQMRLSAALGEHVELVRPDIVEQLVQMQATAPTEGIDAGEPG